MMSPDPRIHLSMSNDQHHMDYSNRVFSLSLSLSWGVIGQWAIIKNGVRRCFLRLTFWENVRPHSSHLCGFSPVCVITWRASSDSAENTFPQKVHVWLASSSCGLLLWGQAWLCSASKSSNLCIQWPQRCPAECAALMWPRRKSRVSNSLPHTPQQCPVMSASKRRKSFVHRLNIHNHVCVSQITR